MVFAKKVCVAKIEVWLQAEAISVNLSIDLCLGK